MSSSAVVSFDGALCVGGNSQEEESPIVIGTEGGGAKREKKKLLDLVIHLVYIYPCAVILRLLPWHREGLLGETFVAVHKYLNRKNKIKEMCGYYYTVEVVMAEGSWVRLGDRVVKSRPKK